MEKIGLFFGFVLTSPKLTKASLWFSDTGVMPCSDTVEPPGIRMPNKVIELDEMVADNARIRREATEIGLYERLLYKTGKFRLEIKEGNLDSKALSDPGDRSLPLFTLFGSCGQEKMHAFNTPTLLLQQSGGKRAVHSAAEGNDRTGRLPH
jgi:hypothetical protein